MIPYDNLVSVDLPVVLNASTYSTHIYTRKPTLMSDVCNMSKVVCSGAASWHAHQGSQQTAVALDKDSAYCKAWLASFTGYTRCKAVAVNGMPRLSLLGKVRTGCS